MASEGTRPAPQPETDLPPEVVNPRPDDPQRCFICLTDEDPSDPPSSWVDPCPCTLEAHQDCMLSWVTNCERSNKPLLCPVCKSKIELEGPWDPLVALTDSVARKFTRASPMLLAGSVSLGVQFSLQMYGALALWTFAGRQALISYVMGPGASVNNAGLLPARDRLGNALVLTNVAPALLIGKLSPWLGNKVFLPTACFYGVYHVMHDDNFLSWPPSPQLAMAIFPYVRSMYYNLWREFVFPYEVNLNRKLIGLPELQPREENQRNEQANANNNDEGGGGGGVIGFLQGILDALDPDDEHDHDVHNGGEVRIVGGAEGEEAGLMLELVIEEVADGEDDFMEILHEGDGESDSDEDMPPLLGLPPRGGPETNEHANQPEPPGEEAREAQPIVEPAVPIGDVPAAQPEAQIPVVVEQPEGQNHEVPQAPPAQRGIGSILSTVSNSIVSALILPGVSFAMGELLRLALPKSWTTRGGAFFWSSAGRPGMLQQQWGRSLIGGCLYVVLKDVVRVYTKHCKVAAMDKRRVKNVDRRRGGSR